jgi:hypothetical protein
VSARIATKRAANAWLRTLGATLSMTLTSSAKRPRLWDLRLTYVAAVENLRQQVEKPKAARAAKTRKAKKK